MFTFLRLVKCKCDKNVVDSACDVPRTASNLFSRSSTKSGQKSNGSGLLNRLIAIDNLGWP